MASPVANVEFVSLLPPFFPSRGRFAVVLLAITRMPFSWYGSYSVGFVMCNIYSYSV